MSPRSNAAAAVVARQLGLPAEPRRSPAPSRPPLRVVEPPRPAPRRLRAGRVGSLAVVLLFAALFAVAAFQTVLIKGQADLDALEERVATEEERQRDLSLAVAELQSPARVTAAAEERLGMVEPGGVVFLRPTEGDDAAAALPPEADRSPDAGSSSEATLPAAGRGGA